MCVYVCGHCTYFLDFSSALERSQTIIGTVSPIVVRYTPSIFTCRALGSVLPPSTRSAIFISFFLPTCPHRVEVKGVIARN